MDVPLSKCNAIVWRHAHFLKLNIHCKVKKIF